MPNPVRIAPAPANASGLGASGAESSYETVLYTCQTCTKRKVKCDRAFPVCSRCRKAKLECDYVSPRSRQKRKLSQETPELQEKLARYERILRDHGLLRDEASDTGFAELPHLSRVEPDRPMSGALLREKDASRYVDSHLWRSLGDDEMQRMSEEAENTTGQGDHGDKPDYPPDPFTDAFLDCDPRERSLLHYYPASEQATILWENYLVNVEPLCKILHVPSTTKMLRIAREQPELVSRADQCLLLCIYYFAVFSMTEEDCTTKLGQTRNTLLERYHSAARRAFVNASFLRTTSITVLQALVLFLMPCRHFFDSHTYWILTGIAVRIGQRLGIHRDGEHLGLPPFHVEMRRRLFYHLLPLDSSAGQISGVGISITPGTWDVKLPFNISDDKIWPEMTELPEEHNGATDMIFCLSRFCIGKHLARLGGPADLESSSHFANVDEAEKSVGIAEAEIEEKYIRYCDVLNPLHFLTMSLARAGIMAMRLKIRLPRIRNQTATDAEIGEAFHIAEKIMDTDTAIHGQENIMKRYRWHTRPFFVWGTWDSFILILTTLWRRRDLLSSIERTAAWNRVGKLYSNHDDLLESKPTLNAGFRRLTLKAWDAQSSDTSTETPEFIRSLRSVCQVKPAIQAARSSDDLSSTVGRVTTERELETFLNSVDGSRTPDMFDGFDAAGVDWGWWDQFVQEDACF
ncbi:hypothetical protein BJY01DRAFT_258024 [Aspergillus pseudoustus]|uniref:Zn(2)-C6 fungal-type domain-containing protein n=1 Tax=Aspergillus pseudoustus TaxID=1810923 RepID=A0ABR4JG70_9EURO